jgi:uncharacterized protein YndB with AHSA1/START domain
MRADDTPSRPRPAVTAQKAPCPIVSVKSHPVEKTMTKPSQATQSKPEELPPLRLSRTLHAPRATVFRAWSSAEHVKRWFCPETFTIPEATVEMRVGGAFAVCMRSPAGEIHWTRGTFVEVTPTTRLVIDTDVTDAAGNKLFRAFTEVDFADALGGTRMDVTQTYTVLDPAFAWMPKGAPEGWRTTLDKLEREVVRMQGGVATGTRSVVHASFDLERTYEAPVARTWTCAPAAPSGCVGAGRAAWCRPSMPSTTTSCPMRVWSTAT